MCYRRLPCLFIADMGIAHGRADILVAEQFLDFPQILSHLVEEDRGRGVAQPMRGDLPYPEGSTGGPQPQIERPVGKRRARISCKHKLRSREGDPPGARMRRPLKRSWMAFQSRSVWLKRPGTGTSWKTLPLPLIRSATISSPTSGNRSRYA